MAVNVDDHDTGELEIYAYTRGGERVAEYPHQNASDDEVRAAQERVASEVMRRDRCGARLMRNQRDRELAEMGYRDLGGGDA